MTHKEAVEAFENLPYSSNQIDPLSAWPHLMGGLSAMVKYANFDKKGNMVVNLNNFVETVRRSAEYGISNLKKTS